MKFIRSLRHTLSFFAVGLACTAGCAVETAGEPLESDLNESAEDAADDIGAIEQVEAASTTQVGISVDAASARTKLKRLGSPHYIRVPPRLQKYATKGSVGGRLRFRDSQRGTTDCIYDIKGNLSHCSGRHRKPTPSGGAPGQFDAFWYVTDVVEVEAVGSGVKGSMAGWDTSACLVSAASLGLSAGISAQIACNWTGMTIVCLSPPGLTVTAGTILTVSAAAALACVPQVGANWRGMPITWAESRTSGCTDAEMSNIRSDIRAACKGGGIDQFTYLVCTDANNRCTRRGAAARLRALDARKCKEARQAEARCRGEQNAGHGYAERHASEAEIACTACARQ